MAINHDEMDLLIVLKCAYKLLLKVERSLNKFIIFLCVGLSNLNFFENLHQIEFCCCYVLILGMFQCRTMSNTYMGKMAGY